MRIVLSSVLSAIFAVLDPNNHLIALHTVALLDPDPGHPSRDFRTDLNLVMSHHIPCGNENRRLRRVFRSRMDRFNAYARLRPAHHNDREQAPGNKNEKHDEKAAIPCPAGLKALALIDLELVQFV